MVHEHEELGVTAAHLRGPAVVLPVRKGCTNKIQFATRAEAVASFVRGSKKLPHLSPYRCKHCFLWHGTSGGMQHPGINSK